MLSTTGDLNAFNKATSIWSNVTCKYEHYTLLLQRIQELNAFTANYEELGCEEKNNHS
jgi:hypothetical protein